MGFFCNDEKFMGFSPGKRVFFSGKKNVSAVRELKEMRFPTTGNGAVAQEIPKFRTTVNKVFFAERLDDKV